jgi:hypothetical protein
LAKSIGQVPEVSWAGQEGREWRSMARKVGNSKAERIETARQEKKKKKEKARMKEMH